MKTFINIAKLNACGSLATLTVEHNGRHDTIDVGKLLTKRNAKAVCLQAAKLLREAADKFEAFGNSKADHFKGVDQDTFNQEWEAKI